MKAAAFVLVLFSFSFLPSLGFAAQIYGTLRESDRPVGGSRIEVECGTSHYADTTDKYGSYKVYAKEMGKCTLTATHRGQRPQAIIESYDDPAHYDFDLIRQPPAGPYRLQRR